MSAADVTPQRRAGALPSVRALADALDRARGTLSRRARGGPVGIMRRVALTRVVFRPAGIVVAGGLAAAATFWLPVGPDLVTTEDYFFDLRTPLGALVLMTGNVVGLAWWSTRRMRRDGVVPPQWARPAICFGIVVLLAALWIAVTVVDDAGAIRGWAVGVSVTLAVIGAGALAAGTGAWHSLHAIAWMATAGWAVALAVAVYLLVWVAPGFELEPGACFSGMDCIGYSSPQTEVTWLAFLFVPLAALPATFQLLILLLARAGRAGRRRRST